jgi:hypothetical protein
MASEGNTARLAARRVRCGGLYWQLKLSALSRLPLPL